MVFTVCFRCFGICCKEDKSSRNIALIHFGFPRPFLVKKIPSDTDVPIADRHSTMAPSLFYLVKVHSLSCSFNIILSKLLSSIFLLSQNLLNYILQGNYLSAMIPINQHDELWYAKNPYNSVSSHSC